MTATDIAPAFTVPGDLAATEPPEARGLARDEVRLLVAGEGPVRHGLFHDLGDLLDPGDLLIVNNSATLPAAVDGTRADGSPVTVHFSPPVDPTGWLVELRRPGAGRVTDGHRGERVTLPAGSTVRLTAAYPDAHRGGSRLWRAVLEPEADVAALLRQHGRPVTYEYVQGRWPLAMYQTVFADEPGSAEMPSAARPFSTALVTRLVSKGIGFAPLTLHTGLSSLETGETPLPERYRVPDSTAALVTATRAGGGRVVAVGTTAARAIETVARQDGTVAAGAGWTRLVLGPDRPARVVDGIITGWHDHDASHLLLLEAIVGPRVLATAYAEALAHRYRWHEFGDTALLLRHL